MKRQTTAGLVAIGLIATSSVASAQMLCAPLLMISAAIVASTEHRELTTKEAFFCGLIRDSDVDKKKVVTKKTKKVAKKEGQ